MSHSLRLMTGVLTTLIFLGIGLSLLTEGSSVIGGFLVALGVFRGVMVTRAVMTRYDDGDEDDD